MRSSRWRPSKPAPATRGTDIAPRPEPIDLGPEPMELTLCRLQDQLKTDASGARIKAGHDRRESVVSEQPHSIDASVGAWGVRGDGAMAQTTEQRLIYLEQDVELLKRGGVPSLDTDCTRTVGFTRVDLRLGELLHQVRGHRFRSDWTALSRNAAAASRRVVHNGQRAGTGATDRLAASTARTSCGRPHQMPSATLQTREPSTG